MFQISKGLSRAESALNRATVPVNMDNEKPQFVKNNSKYPQHHLRTKPIQSKASKKPIKPFNPKHITNQFNPSTLDCRKTSLKLPEIV